LYRSRYAPISVTSRTSSRASHRFVFLSISSENSGSTSSSRDRAHAAHLLGDEVDEGDVDEETIERLEAEVAEIEAVVESIQSEYEND